MAKIFLTNGQFYSFNPSGIFADTIEIENGRIRQVGAAREILPVSKKGHRIIDLKRSLVLPGFTDSHIHLLEYGLSLQRLDATASTKNECLNLIKREAEKTPPGKWIIGHGWDHNIWREGLGNNEDLDRITNLHPIYLTHKSLHCGWANSAALKEAGISSKTSDPPNGMIQRDKNKKLSGILFESAMQLIESKIPAPDDVKIISALLLAQSTLNAFGITMVHDFDRWSIYSTLRDLAANDKLSLRVTKGIPRDNLVEAIRAGLRSGFGDELVRTGWLKLFADGALGPQTAAMLAPYEGSENMGILFLNEEEIIEIGVKALQSGIALAIHAIGDCANRTVLRAYQSLDEMGCLDTPALASRIEHAQIVDEQDMPFFKNADVIASMQPIHAISDMEMAETHWAERCRTAYPWRSLLEHGASLVFGSDAPVESPNPFHGISAAVSRTRIYNEKMKKELESWTPHQCIGLDKALKAYCHTPAETGGFSDVSGSIVPGMSADLVLLPKDFLRFTAEDIHDTLPTATMLRGKWVHNNDKIHID